HAHHPRRVPAQGRRQGLLEAALHDHGPAADREDRTLAARRRRAARATPGAARGGRPATGRKSERLSGRKRRGGSGRGGRGGLVTRSEPPMSATGSKTSNPRAWMSPALLGAAVAFLGGALLVSWYLRSLHSITPGAHFVP